MGIIELFNNTLNKAYADLLERLEFGKENRMFLSGYNADGLIALIAGRNVNGKIFTVEQVNARLENPKVVELRGEMLEKIAAFPENTFDVIYFSWPPDWKSAVPVLEEFRRIAKPNSQTAVLALKDSTPTPVMAILKKSFVKKFQGRLKFSPPSFPEGTKAMRKVFGKAGFVNSRIWEDSFTIDISEALLREYAEILLRQLLPAEDKRINSDDLLDEFLAGLKENCSGGILHVTYGYLGGIGYK